MTSFRQISDQITQSLLVRATQALKQPGVSSLSASEMEQLFDQMTEEYALDQPIQFTPESARFYVTLFVAQDCFELFRAMLITRFDPDV